MKRSKRVLKDLGARYNLWVFHSTLFTFRLYSKTGYISNKWLTLVMNSEKQVTLDSTKLTHTGFYN